MKCALILVLLTAAISMAAQDERPAARGEVVHLATALNHITVLEFGEPVTMAAAGSAAFNIEWRADKVLIKPLQPEVSTDLFVWTASRRFTYELDRPGEVKNMNFAVENPIPASKPAPQPHDQMTEVADMVLTRAFLGAERIENRGIKNDPGGVVVRIENVFQSSNSLYIRYSLENLTREAYRVSSPAIYELVSPSAKVSLFGIQRTQLDSRTMQRLGEKQRIALAAASAATQKQDVPPGEMTRGVIVLRAAVHRAHNLASRLRRRRRSSCRSYLRVLNQSRLFPFPRTAC